MRLLGIDYGTKRVGLALTDESGVMAFPYGVLPNDDALAKEIEKVAVKEKVEQIVIGHSLNGRGEANAIHKDVEELMLDLTLASGIPIELEPEQYSTQEATQIQGRNDQTDASAATIILNSYLARQKN